MSTAPRTVYLSFMGAGAIFFAGWISSAAYFNIKEKWHHEAQLVHVETQVVPKLKTEVIQKNCDAYKLAGVAIDAITAAKRAGATDAPDYSDVSGCPKVNPVPAPKPTEVLKAK